MTGNGRPNLRQIADELGLSVTTVSRALKDGPEVRPETIERVKIAAKAAGYVPNPHGRALRTGQTRTLTAILPMETRDYLSDIAKLPLIEGLTLGAQEHGYGLTVYSTTPEDDPEENLAKLVQAGSADGVVITRMVRNDPRIPYLEARKTPFIAFGRCDGGQDHAYVDIDNEGIAYEATRLLFERGARRIALQSLKPEDQYSVARAAGYVRAHADAGHTVDHGLIGREEFTMEAAEAWLDRLLDLPGAPDALVCANELGLLGALSTLRRRRLAPGRDFHIAVRDSTHLCRYLSAPLITHSVDMVDVGRKLVDGLVQRVENPDTPPMRIVLKGALGFID